MGFKFDFGGSKTIDCASPGPYNKGDRIFGSKLGFAYFGKVSCWVQGWGGLLQGALCSGLAVRPKGWG